MGIVPHTHWDREWHVPFQAGRVRLVRLLDAVLDDLESGRLGYFWLDGQTAAIDDYLAVRPDAGGRVRATIAAGRLGVGPWAVPMDEFVVSPETIVRNLDAGLRRRGELGASGPSVAYLPDIFGHVAQLPQLLRAAGIGHAVVWRGVPAQIAAATTAFRWETPDGSAVRAEYLFGSYANGRSLPANGSALASRARSWEEEVGDRRVAGLLLMNGGDQRMAETWVPAAVAAANRAQTRYRFEVADLAQWLEQERAAVPDSTLPSWRGELRSAAGAPLLAGVISNRIDVRAVAAAAERAVERRAEPILALFRPAGEWAAAAGLLAVAWERLIANSAHDSACACCADPVADQVLVRYAEARQIGDALADQALDDLAAETGVGPRDVLVLNTRPDTRAGVVEVALPAGRDPSERFAGPDGEPRAVQQLGIDRREVFAARVSGEKVGWVADRIVGCSFDGLPVRVWTLDPPPVGDPAMATLQFEAAGPDDATVDLAEARRALLALGAAGRSVDVRMQDAPRRRVLIDTGLVAGFGWSTLRRFAEGVVPGGTCGPQESVRVTAAPGGPVLDNGIVGVAIDSANGTFKITTDAGLRAEGLNCYVDGGDGGDTYTWCPPEIDTVIDRPSAVKIDTVESGPLRGRVLISATYHWPAAAEGDEHACQRRSPSTMTVEIRTTVSLLAGDPVVGVETVLDNRVLDHRLRVHFPLPAPVAGSAAGCAFAVVHRGLETETGVAETPPPTFPARRFVDCSDGEVGIAVLADGTFEYEVLDDGAELAVTLLRATGWLSRRRLALRPDPAGPAVPVWGAQVQGDRQWRYGLLLHSGDWEQAAVSRRADAFLNPLEAKVGSTVVGSGAASPTRPPAGQALRVDGAEVSAVTRDGDDVAVRVFNPGSESVAACVAGESARLAPGQIATIRARGRPEPG